MKVGIISINMYSKGLNFACPLHSYAFQQFLTKNGIDNIVINYKPVYYDGFNLKHPYDYYTKKMAACHKRLARAKTSEERSEIKEKIAEHEEKQIAYSELYFEREGRYNKFQKFIDEKYVKTDICYDSDLLEVMDPGCDMYICATDVIWKNQPGNGFDRGYFLGSSCMENKYKLSYAASRGVYFADNKEDEELFFHYLEDFDTITVREESLKKYIEENSSITATRVLDPVLLHEKEFYDEIAKKPKEEGYLFLYYVQEKAKDTLKYAVRYARKHKLKIVEITDVPEKEGRLTKYTDVETIYKYDVSIEEWLGYFKYADCVFTNSFHACCFSILFQKDLYVGFRHGDKVTNVLETFGMQERLLTENPDEMLKKKMPPIDYEKVSKILEEKRKESSEFILSAIRACEGKTKEKDYSAYKKELSYPIIYNCRLKNKPFEISYDKSNGKIEHLSSGSIEYSPKGLLKNDGMSRVEKNGYTLEHHKFLGWNIRFRIDNRWFWYLADGTMVEKSSYAEKKHGLRYVVEDGGMIPHIPVNHIAKVVAEACWQDEKLIKLVEEVKKDVKTEVKTESLWKKVKRRLRKMLE